MLVAKVLVRLAPLALVACVAACGGSDVEDPTPFDVGGDNDQIEGSRQPRSEMGDPVLSPEGSLVETPIPSTTPGTEAPTSPTPKTPTPAPTSTATVKIDNVSVTVKKITLWAPNADGQASVFLEVAGTGAPVGTDLHITFTKVAQGCVASPKPKPQDLWFRLPTDQYHSTDGIGCGLKITSFPAKVGDDAAGTFDGNVAGINGVSGKTRKISVSFRTTRTR